MSKKNDDLIPNRVHCPKCGKRAWKFYVEEYGDLQGVDSYNPYYKWHVMGTCKTHGLVEVKPHDEDDWNCLCGTVYDWDVWWAEDL